MSTTAVTAAAFPLLNALFVRPTLLEVRVPLEQLNAEIKVSDEAELVQLSGRKGEKLAKRWAALIVHNLFHGIGQPSEAMLAYLAKAEAHLSKVAGSPWAAAFRAAGEKGLPPTNYIMSLPIGTKKVMSADTKAWREAGNMVEKDLARGILGSAEQWPDAYLNMTNEDPIVSLKKIAKFTPRAA